MIPAYMIGMALNKKVCSIDELINDILPSSGYSRETSTVEVRDVLIVDDSIHSGVALGKTKEKIDNSTLRGKYNIKYLAIYAREQSIGLVDYYFEIVPLPRLFQWNYLNVKMSEKFCYDIDGVLCVDPTEEENDDGERYREFLLNAKPLFIPRSKIYALVTSRLEKYRPETEQWLKEHDVQYDNLFMLDLPNKEARIRSNSHAKFKASIYEKVGAVLFLESNDKQAREIAKLTGKQVICVETDCMYCGSESSDPQTSNTVLSSMQTDVDYSEIYKKKILLFTQEFTYTGSPHSLLRIVKILKKQDYYVEVWGPKYGPFVAEFEKNDVLVRIVPYELLREPKIIQIARNFDLSIVNTVIPYKYYNFIKPYCPTIWYIREAQNLSDICKTVPERTQALKDADRLYCVSEYAKDYIMSNYNRNVKVIHNCVEDETGSAQYHKKSVGGLINFIQMGSITERKAFDIVVSAF